jgi:anti-sigma regulatory factor (Ser/Thr protein kinase)
VLSIFNMGGRFFWSSLSDKIGRKATFATFFVIGALLYAAVPSVGAMQNVVLFVAVFCVLLSMYGGGFATAPAYMRDLFGALEVGAVYGRLLTAWSVAGIVGPLLMNSMRQLQLGRGIAPSQAYNQSMYLLAGLLVLGFVSNLLVRPVALAVLCREVIGEMTLAYPERALWFEPVGDDVCGDWDPDRLAQVLRNLLSNALEHGDQESPVNLAIHDVGNAAELSVANRGEPIPEELRPHLFEPFRRGGSGDGAGLGLYIVDQIVHAHGGSVELRSDATTVFTVKLPKG